ncbi:rhodanese-like domain-containing protein [Sulfurimonas sp. HSL-3221]|uniref:rhodanese-like domain-containing protein n=1 Tax=Sulfurimonadaceae TaxID=2771471 RepID=UPI001E3EF845|nr:rhodanese-like domain-containing protein [Sulfurimonas sp. HSL-3221]UFS62853.1 rhodanese-like domain-containing protein [Sulfurimonas sp. HSL-3221]
MRKTVISLIALSALAASAFAYDAAKAAEFDGFFSHMTHKACANSTLFVKADDVMKMLREAKPMLLLDIRTEGEASVVGLGTAGSRHVPVEHLFEKTNLDALPTDRPIILVCYSGTRATMAAMGLKMIGIKNVQVLKGGIVALATSDTTKNAPIKESK